MEPELNSDIDLELAEDGGVIHDPLCVGSITRNHHDPKIPHDHLHLKPQRHDVLLLFRGKIQPEGDNCGFMGPSHTSTTHVGPNQSISWTHHDEVI